MNKLIIEPGQSIGDIQLGMNKDEVDVILQNTTLHHVIEYDEHQQVKFIEIPLCSEDSAFDLKDFNIDPSATKADELVQLLSERSPYEDNDDSRLGFCYRFPHLGLSLWRPGVLREEDLQADWYKEMPVENQEDELKYFYFESIGVFESC